MIQWYKVNYNLEIEANTVNFAETVLSGEVGVRNAGLTALLQSCYSREPSR